MHARISTVDIKPGTWDDTLAVWRERIIPSLRGQRGFKGVRVFGDRAAGKAASLTLWETEEDAQASISSAQMEENLRALGFSFAGQPAQQHYEVLIEEGT